ncbi:cobalamin B12-binding domain-containing protein [Clostridium luticellarii]|jgi:5-methyltetrahydrofolate--homocysteine methyltransferase|uniref:Methionine synthase n=1 Tax=Clostridium luticellarii TaxID=1691940 RepID=A0A2T0BLU3_9CLOT|nr:cobalamin-dependent protein [Clostridium luticellarii]MCI1944954.1 cobalamin-dependent protein [Clostridium luticellarii]MCI1967896.1 cobalamin-dependent protein [Clostridium luticellarii]MCI1996627.1 cobalamin-dependent protein [Clostridium luticellarii]MCI2040841.1 cobalamin-dependent protein [Clostridium luticellarii]PRR84847.1 Methionine synthase [Clostridium luticellarii]
MDLKELSSVVQTGSQKKSKELVKKALDEKIEPVKILNDGLIEAMSEIGVKFKNNEIYVPEMLMAAKAMAAGMKVLEPILTKTGIKPVGKAVIGTVKGDLHDIGKNLVAMMMKGTGIEVTDLGVDADPAKFLKKAEEIGADIVCMSALLTTTMPAMNDTIKEFEKAGVKDKYIFMVGGAPLSDEYAKEIGADYYTPDAGSAAEVAKNAVLKKGK